MQPAPVLLSVKLWPSRSLGPRGFAILMLVLGLYATTLGLVLAAAGAWPVAGFLGLDVLAVWLAFRASFRAQRRQTFVEVTPELVTVRDIDPRGRESLRQMPAGFARVAAVPGAIRLQASGQQLALGEFLNPSERRRLASRLSRALDDARAYRPHLHQSPATGSLAPE